MLIDKGAVAGEVVTLKLISGEEIVGKLVEETDKELKLSKPMQLSMSQQGVGMIPFLFTVDPDKELKISKSSVIVICSTEKQFANQYLQGTTGIAMK
jgi:hypothetical protein